MKNINAFKCGDRVRVTDCYYAHLCKHVTPPIHNGVIGTYREEYLSANPEGVTVDYFHGEELRFPTRHKLYVVFMDDGTTCYAISISPTPKPKVKGKR